MNRKIFAYILYMHKDWDIYLEEVTVKWDSMVYSKRLWGLYLSRNGVLRYMFLLCVAYFS